MNPASIKAGPKKRKNDNEERLYTPKRRYRNCACNWPNCRELHRKLPAGDIWKGQVRLNLVVGSKLYESVYRNLGIEEDAKSPSPSWEHETGEPKVSVADQIIAAALVQTSAADEQELEPPDPPNQPELERKQLFVNRHHWTRSMIHDHLDKGKRWQSHIDFRQACRLLYVVDDKEATTEGSRSHATIKEAALAHALSKSTTEEKVYVRAPNVPGHVVAQYCQLTSPLPASTIDHECLENRNDIIEKLYKENRRLLNSKRREHDKVVELQRQVKQLEKQARNAVDEKTHVPVNRIMEFMTSSSSGLTRFTMLSDAWHASNPTAALQLFGYKTWDETKQHIMARFPGIKPEDPSLYVTRKGPLEMGHTSEWEKCLAVKLMDRTGLTVPRAALIFGRNERTLTTWRNTWCPKWGMPKPDGHEQSRNRSHMNLIPNKMPASVAPQEEEKRTEPGNDPIFYDGGFL